MSAERHHNAPHLQCIEAENIVIRGPPLAGKEVKRGKPSESPPEDF